MTVNEQLIKIKDCMYRVAIKAVIVNDGKILLARDKSDTKFCFPGGGVDYDEDLAVALKRELHEELGVQERDVESDYSVLAIAIGHQKAGIPRLNIFTKVSLRNIILAPSNEIEECRWVSLQELKSMELDETTGDIKQVIKCLENSIKPLS